MLGVEGAGAQTTSLSPIRSGFCFQVRYGTKSGNLDLPLSLLLPSKQGILQQRILSPWTPATESPEITTVPVPSMATDEEKELMARIGQLAGPSCVGTKHR